MNRRARAVHTGSGATAGEHGAGGAASSHVEAARRTFARLGATAQHQRADARRWRSGSSTAWPRPAEVPRAGTAPGEAVSGTERLPSCADTDEPAHSEWNRLPQVGGGCNLRTQLRTPTTQYPSCVRLQLKITVATWPSSCSQLQLGLPSSCSCSQLRPVAASCGQLQVKIGRESHKHQYIDM